MSPGYQTGTYLFILTVIPILRLSLLLRPTPTVSLQRLPIVIIFSSCSPFLLFLLLPPPSHPPLAHPLPPSLHPPHTRNPLSRPLKDLIRRTLRHSPPLRHEGFKLGVLGGRLKTESLLCGVEVGA